MDKRIYLSESGMKKLREIFKVSHVMVWKALTYKSDSELARKIRYTALSQLGGTASKDLQESVECETNHEEVAKTMTQTFGDRVKLVFDKESNMAHEFVDGKEVRKVVCLNVADFISFQLGVGMRAIAL